VKTIEESTTKPIGIAAYLVCAILVITAAGGAISLYDHFYATAQQITQESRGNQWVGEKATPREPIQIVVRNSPRVCVKIEDVNIVDENLIVFTRRVCGQADDYAEAHWRAEASDGTVINSGMTNWEIDESEKGQRSEWDAWRYETFDARITRVVLWTSN
jgi:hypothetical protein